MTISRRFDMKMVYGLLSIRLMRIIVHPVILGIPWKFYKKAWKIMTSIHMETLKWQILFVNVWSGPSNLVWMPLMVSIRRKNKPSWRFSTKMSQDKTSSCLIRRKTKCLSLKREKGGEEGGVAPTIGFPPTYREGEGEVPFSLRLQRGRSLALPPPVAWSSSIVALTSFFEIFKIEEKLYNIVLILWIQNRWA